MERTRNSRDDGNARPVGGKSVYINVDRNDNSNDNGDGKNVLGGSARTSSSRVSRNDANAPSLSAMFAQPTHLMHADGGFLGAKNFANDAQRWLLVNIQNDDDFACHALNRDVWRDKYVESLVREGFILWQAVSQIACGWIGLHCDYLELMQ